MTSPEGRFWELVGAETRATWAGRWRWVWRVAAAMLIATCLFLPPKGIGGDWFLPLVAIGSLLPALLCSDLLSLEFRSNPEPQREWPFRAYIARFVGRLLPFFAAETLWIGAFTLRSLLADSNPSTYRSDWELVGYWLAWILVFLASGLPYAVTAALLSSAMRHPRRWLVTPSVSAVGMTVASLLQLFVPPIMGTTGSMPDVSQQVQYFGYSAFFIGFSTVVAVLKNLEALSWLPKPLLENAGTFPFFCLIATVAFVLYSALVTVWLRIIVNRRLRRHPYPSTRPLVAEPESDRLLAGVSDAGI